MSEPAVSGITALYRDYVLPMTPRPVIEQILEASFDPETPAQHLTSLIEKNPFYAEALEKLDILQEKVKEWREDFPEEKGTKKVTQFTTTLLGHSLIRSALLAIWVTRTATNNFPRKKGVAFLIMPRTTLRFASSVSAYFDENTLAHADVAYLGGFSFDWVMALMERKGGAVKSEKKYLDEIWPDAIKTARIAFELAAIPKNLALSSYAFPSVLLIYLGNALMTAAFSKEWKDFQKLLEGLTDKAPLAQLVLEKRKFAFTHAEAAALCSCVIPMLRPAERAVRYYQEPYLIKTEDRESFKLAAILSCAFSLKRAKSPSWASLNAVQKSWLSDLRVEEADIQTVLERIKG